MNPLSLSTKAALILGALLLISASGNVWLARDLWMGQQKAADAAVLAEVAAERDGYKFTAEVNKAVAGQKKDDTTVLLARLDAIADRGEQVRTVYRTAAARAPLDASCAPGGARVDAVNEGLGPTTSTEQPTPARPKGRSARDSESRVPAGGTR